jgi:uncharacterized protein YdaU (DUF1376 family)
MPFEIDAFKASSFVQRSESVARLGYIYLLTAQWQTDECSLPGDDQELFEMCGLTADEWAQHKDRILKKFISLPGGRLRNQAGFEKWSEAKRITESRRDGALKGNAIRWGKEQSNRSAITKGLPRQSSNSKDSTVLKASTPPNPHAAARGNRDEPDPSKNSAPTADANAPTSSAESAVAPAQTVDTKGKRKRSGGAETRSESSGGGNLHKNSADAVGVPPKKIAPQYTNGADGPKTDKGSDVGFESFKQEIFQFWSAGDGGGIPCPWTDVEDRALRQFMRSNPGVVLWAFKELLKNRARSQDVNNADPPRKWIRDLVKYAAGPLDRYGKPLHEERSL